MQIKLVFIILIIVFLSSCSFISTQKAPPGGANESIIVSTKTPDLSRCKFLGQINQTQRNSANRLFTSNSNLEIRTISDLKVEAFKIGGNYVEIIVNKNELSNTNKISNVQANIDNIVNIYKCNDTKNV